MTTSFEETTSNKPLFEPFFELVKTGKIDGFYVSTDNASYITDHPLVLKLHLDSYQAPGGVLLFKSARHTRYGFETVDDFAHDCAAGLLQCKTVEGALTLGPARKLTGSIEYVCLYGSGLNSAPVFHSESQTQSQAIKRRLEEAYPGSVVRILSTNRPISLERFRSFQTKECWHFLFFKAPPNVRLWFRIFIGTILFTMLSLVFNLFNLINAAPSWIGMICFVLTFFAFTVISRKESLSLALISEEMEQKKSSRKKSVEATEPPPPAQVPPHS